MDALQQRALEQKAGQKAARKLRTSIQNLVKHGFETTQGNSEILKSTVLAKVDGPELQRLAIIKPHYAFKHHFGFDGVRSNGAKLRLYKHQGLINQAVKESDVLEKLADEISEIRADQVTSLIKF